MGVAIMKAKQQQIRGRNRPHWSILTLDDLDKMNWKHSLLINQLQAQYQAAKEPGNDKSSQELEDLSISE